MNITSPSAGKTRPRPRKAAEVTTRDLYQQTEKEGDRPYSDPPGLGAHLGAILSFRWVPQNDNPSMTRLERSYRKLGVSRLGNAEEISKSLKAKKRKKTQEMVAMIAGSTLGPIGAGAAWLWSGSPKLAAGATVVGAAVSAVSAFKAKSKHEQAQELGAALEKTQQLTENILR